MKKLFLLSLLFVCPWLAQASEVKHEAEQKQVARHEPLTGPDLGRLHKESRARHEVARKQVAQHEAVEAQDFPAPVLAASSAAAASQAALNLSDEERRAQIRMEEQQRNDRAQAEAAIRAAAVVPGPAEERARAHHEPRSWKDIAAASLYLVVHIPLLAVGNGMVNNILARNAGLGVKRWLSCRASWWDFMSDAAFLVLQLRCAERFFRQIGLNQRPATVRWGVKFGAHVLVLQPMIYLLQRLGEAIPLGKFGPALRSRTISVTLPLSIASLGLVGMLLMDEYDDMLERRRNRRGRARA